MSLPQWITPAGSLGTVSELEYYQHPLDAFDTSGGTFIFTLVSGKLPIGLQIIPNGIIQGIPVSDTSTGTGTITYTFTVRAKNSSTGFLADRTFSINVVDVVPPIIEPKNVDFGLVLDGTIIDIQLIATEPLPGAILTWSVKRGVLPDGITLTPEGHLTGYLHPIPMPGFGSMPQWDEAPWDLFGWEFTIRAIIKAFTFTIQVSDGVNVDTTIYQLSVFPRSYLTADNNIFTIQLQFLGGGTGHLIPYTVDIGNRHTPIITTVQSDFIPVRQGSYFAFHLRAFDLDNDVLQYFIPALASGGYDEQTITFGNVTYITATVINNSVAVYIDDSTDIINTPFTPGTNVKFLGVTKHWQNASINENTTVVLSGNVSLSASVGNYVTQEISGANAIIANVSPTYSTLELGGGELLGNIHITGTYHTGTLYVNSPITANIGSYITQLISGANATITANVTNISAIPISLYGSDFFYGSGVVEVNASPTTAVPISLSLDPVLISANIGDYITQPSVGANAIVTSNISLRNTVNVRFLAGEFNLISGSGNISINGSSIAAYPIGTTQTFNPFTVSATTGDHIYQPSTGANVVVTADVGAGTAIPVQYITGVFNTGAGNLQLNGSNIELFPTMAVRHTPLAVTYQPSSTGLFNLHATDMSQIAYINGVSSNLYPTLITSVGITPGGLATEGIVGFDDSKFDQGTLLLPTGLSIDVNTGWVTGRIPYQSVNQIDYSFEVVVSKRDYSGYEAKTFYTLTVLGDLNNKIDWVTPTNLGIIENGKISDLFVQAISTKGKVLFYQLTVGKPNRLPQGLELTTDGLIAGRVSFELFSLDRNTTTLDKGTTFFDNLYTFTITASDFDQSIAASKTFTVTVIKRTFTPYEDLYLKAMLSFAERGQLRDILINRTVFPPKLIYRNTDPNFGVVTDLKTLFLPGLSPSTLAQYTQAAQTNHFTKRLLFGDIKTAVALDSNFNIKYEVVYVDVFDENTNDIGQGPSDTINLSEIISHPHDDANGNSFNIAYPDAFNNMTDRMVTLGYANKGALPDWMTSRQPDGRVLGFTHAVVLAYTIPGASSLIAFRFNQQNYNLNSLDFTIDRYLLDNNYSSNFDVAAGAFIPSFETTFDRFVRPGGVFKTIGTVDYAVHNLSFQDINARSVSYINQIGGIDGIKNFKNGQTLVFFNQEFNNSQFDAGYYNMGWSNSVVIWDQEPWAFDPNVIDDTLPGGDPTPGEPWDSAIYVPGFQEHLENPAVTNQRIGIWQINILSGNIVKLTFVNTLSYYDIVHVRFGSITSANIFYDPVVKANNTLPNYSVISQQIKITGVTTFDGNGTRFFDHRDQFSNIPESGDKYVGWTQTNVFN